MPFGNRAVIYGIVVVAATGAIIFGHAPIRCFQNPLSENSLAAPCSAASSSFLLSTPLKARALTLAANYNVAAGDMTIGISQITHAIELDPSSAMTRESFAAVLYQAGHVEYENKSYPAAIVHFTKVLDQIPSHTDSLLERAFSYLKLEQYERAIADYDAALKQSPSLTNALNNRGYGRYRLGFTKDAIQDFSRTLEIDPKNIYALTERAYARNEIEDYAGAIEDSNRALAIDAKDDSAHEAKTDALKRQKKFDECIAALDAWESAVGTKTAHMEQTRGYVLERKGYNKSALEALDRAVALDPKQAWAYRYRGYIKMMLGDNQAALADLDHAILLGDGEAPALKASIDKTRLR